MKFDIDDLLRAWLHYHGYLYYNQDKPEALDSTWDLVYRALTAEENRKLVIPILLSPTQIVGCPFDGNKEDVIKRILKEFPVWRQRNTDQ